ncbi:MAG: hypothetical protein K9W45_12125 [Candidatus Heimdallarchaeum aukensis]|uniref:Ig-like domain-containing protein n=1 Tax=Candidatus Heimdallarchaeum aukensis TaxID=2876573 RepID=A0A9Y1BKL0_9ARCH|nr:MAG: hypothetical protein K9W45_12125 [Candidatus Heimdallarchaeum aukensis]
MKELKKFSQIILITAVLITASVEVSLNIYLSSNRTLDRETPIKFSSEYSFFGTPQVSPDAPNSNETATVSLTISDSDEIRNATLWWKYISLNDTLFNASMSRDLQLVVDETEFESTGYITDTGIKTNDKTEWRYGEYIFIANEGDVIKRIYCSIDKETSRNNLVYVSIEAFNITSETWEQRYIDGSYGGTEEVSPFPVDYDSTESVLGYKIFAITHIGDHPNVNDPVFNYLRIYEEYFSGDITPPSVTTNTPTWVEYYVTSFDLFNNSMTSETYTFLMDWTPKITIHEVPTVINADTGFVFNVTVTDYDGVETINDTSVTLYYKIEGEEDYKSQNFEYLTDLSSTAASYRTTLQIDDISNVEANLLYMINASDIVDSKKGREGSSGLKTAIVDNMNPRVNSISIYGGISIPGIENVTLTSSEVNITAKFVDPSGTKRVDILYSMPNGTTFLRKQMVNTTPIEEGTSPTTFTVILPETNETTFVEYFFETYDFFDNVGNTSVNFYYADGAAPILGKLLVNPPVISNITDVQVLFNATDYTDLKTSVVWYSTDGGITWNNTISYVINYNSFMDYMETFTAVDLPALIEDNSTTLVTLNVERGGGVSEATLNVDITHEKSADIRIWLELDDGREFLIFDRETRPTSFTLSIDLLELGLTQSDFTEANFTLKITDYSDLYSGSVINYEIVLKHYTIPIGYEFISTIPRTNMDTDVLFYITLTDALDNSVNSSTFSYYSDGLAPNISLIPITSPLDLAGGYDIEVQANVTDKGGLLTVEVYYTFDEESDWKILSMKYDSSISLYTVSIPVIISSGNLTYKVRAYDLAGFSSESNITIIEFTKALAPIIIVLDTSFSSPLVLEEKAIRIRANVTDDGNITNVLFSYKFATEDEWMVETMLYNNETDCYFFDIELPKKSGTLIFKISATDDSSLTTETEIFEINYSVEKEINPLMYIIPLAAVGGIGLITVILLLLKKKGLVFAKTN